MHKLTEEQVERQCVEEIYGLTGGELNSTPLTYRNEAGQEHAWRYNYDGVPEWAIEDFRGGRYDRTWEDRDYFTVISIDAPYGTSAPDIITIDGDDIPWIRLREYQSGGERECPLGSAGADETVGEDSTDGMDRCPLCEADKGEEHGYIYLGHGVETIYRRAIFRCAKCHIGVDDLTDDAPACDCVDEEDE